MMNVVAVDPGGTTGIAAARFDDGKILAFASREFSDPMEAVGHVDDLIMAYGPDVDVAVERYTITPNTLKKSAQYDALYIIGAIMYVAREHGHSVTLQQPSAAKRFATNERLNVVGWRNSTPGGHADDAARHALIRAIHLKLIDPGEFA